VRGNHTAVKLFVDKPIAKIFHTSPSTGNFTSPVRWVTCSKASESFSCTKIEEQANIDIP
jgi:hypothetical protein